jgi:hypothetical protein
MKVAPIMKAFNESGKFKTLLVHTGQEYKKLAALIAEMKLSDSIALVERLRRMMLLNGCRQATYWFSLPIQKGCQTS